MRLQNVKSEEYENNGSPKVGDLVRLSQDIENGVDMLYKVVTYLLGGKGNKVLIEPANPVPGKFGMNQREYYFYCLCPQ
jgi:hypothetical protein